MSILTQTAPAVNTATMSPRQPWLSPEGVGSAGTLLPTPSPADRGTLDARLGRPCNPDAYFGQPNDYDGVGAKYDRADYCYAYACVKGL